jgi:hypothetical protein
MTRDALATILGLMVGVGTGIGLCLDQFERRPSDGQRVVAWVYKSRVVETPLRERCLVMGLGLGVSGGVVGYHLGRGAGLVPTAVVAGLAVWLVSHVESGLPQTHGRAGEDTRAAGLVFVGFLGAAVGARASVMVRR